MIKMIAKWIEIIGHVYGEGLKQSDSNDSSDSIGDDQGITGI